MPSKDTTLDLARFLDSDHARALEPLGADDVRRVATAFLEVCHGELGKPAHELDGEDVRVALTELLPRRVRPRDPFAEHVPTLLAKLVDHLEEEHVLANAFEVRLALLDHGPAFVERVASGENAAEQVAERAKPFEHGASKLGRNDPCSCGSGKKYKKCHGRGA